MEIIREVSTWIAKRKQFDQKNLRIGFVPTMGALHAGHAALLKRARKENDIVVLSIFVNPTQFNNSEDLKKYPRTLEKDYILARECNTDFILEPQANELYPDGYSFRVIENDLSTLMEGAHRPGHFDGVLSVVMKLFNMVRPNSAYFGEKDYQQLELIKGMVAAFFLPIEVIACETIREKSGLALSSRNTRLSHRAIDQAPLINQLLRSDLSPEKVRQNLEAAGFEVDYVEQFLGRRFVAASVEGVRLIDNVATPIYQPREVYNELT